MNEDAAFEDGVRETVQRVRAALGLIEARPTLPRRMKEATDHDGLLCGGNFYKCTHCAKCGGTARKGPLYIPKGGMLPNSASMPGPYALHAQLGGIPLTAAEGLRYTCATCGYEVDDPCVDVTAEQGTEKEAT